MFGDAAESDEGALEKVFVGEVEVEVFGERVEHLELVGVFFDGFFDEGDTEVNDEGEETISVGCHLF